MNKNIQNGSKGITLIALVITIIVLLILAGVTISQLTGSDSAPAKANEAKQKNDIGAAKDEVSILVQNALTDAYQSAYVDGNSTRGGASTDVGDAVIGAANTQYALSKNYKVGSAYIKAEKDSATGNGKVTIWTTDFKVEGTIDRVGGILSWGEIGANGGNNSTAPYGGLATESEVNPNLFVYKVLTDPTTAKVEGVEEKGKVADTTGNIKVADLENKGTVEIVKMNEDYIFSSGAGFTYGMNYYEQNNYNSSDGDIEDVYIEQFRKVMNNSNKLVIPAEVTLNGKKYTVTKIGDDALHAQSGAGDTYNLNYYMRETIEEIVLPNTITEIGEMAFCSQEKLKRINIPSTVSSIGNYAFCYCYGLESITIPNSVTSIGEHVFGECSSLESITIPNNVTSIGDYAFSSCSGLESITIPNSVTSIGNDAFFRCSSLASITIPNSVTSIGDYAFEDCSSLASITIPNSVTSIGNSVLSGCSSLASITIPNSVTSIGTEAFRYCSSLASITIPNSVTSIGNSVLSGCSSLASITIPNSVTSIGDYALWWCDNLQNITYTGTCQQWISLTNGNKRFYWWLSSYMYGRNLPI